MPKLPCAKPREVIKVLERAGFVFIKQSGSHRIYVKGKLGVTVAYHNKDLKPKTLKHIIKQSGLELEGFIELF